MASPSAQGLMPSTLFSNKNYRTGVIMKEEGNRLVITITSTASSKIKSLVGGFEMKYALVMDRNNITPWKIPTGIIHAYPGGQTGNLVHSSCNEWAPTVSFTMKPGKWGDFILTIDFDGDLYYECSTYMLQGFEISKI